MNARTWKKLGACLCAGTLAAVLCAGCASKASDDAAQPLVNGVTDRQEVVYCLYFGLTDKDTGKQELTMEEAKDIAIPLFIEAGSGYTVYEAEGGFAKEDGTVVQNDTLVFDSTHGDEQAILDLIEKVRRALNVESVYGESKLVGCGIRGGVRSGVSEAADRGLRTPPAAAGGVRAKTIVCSLFEDGAFRRMLLECHRDHDAHP